MLIWLSGTDNRKGAPNENYGRELMELFTLGEGNGYTERDVREQARALTGWTSTWTRSKGETNFRFDPTRHDAGRRPCSASAAASPGATRSPSASTTRSTPRSSSTSSGATSCPSRRTRRRAPASIEIYERGFEVRPVLEAILRHPALYTGPRMVKPPVVYIAGLLRGLGRGIDTTAWVWLAEGAGQRLFYPPNVAGWDDSRWLDTNTFHGRWSIANTALEKVSLGDRKGKKAPKVPNDPEAIVKGALAVLGNPDDPPRDAARAARVRPWLAEERDRLEGGRLSAARRQRGASAPRRLPRPQTC